jgi:hypothetical protein
MQKTLSIPNKNREPLYYVFENNLVSDVGLWLEFGVYSGTTINYISKFTKNNIYGFDSFEGLPETWTRTDGSFNKGFFDRGGILPKVNNNVLLLKGWFDNTLPEFLKKNREAVYFLHIDCDIYSSTKIIFELLYNRIANNCVIVFDELINYPGFEEHEWKAWWEFVNKYNIIFEWICMNGDIQTSNIRDRGAYDQKVAVIIKDNPSFGD